MFYEIKCCLAWSLRFDKLVKLLNALKKGEMI
jgi:hypothetical protein